MLGTVENNLEPSLDYMLDMLLLTCANSLYFLDNLRLLIK